MLHRLHGLGRGPLTQPGEGKARKEGLQEVEFQGSQEVEYFKEGSESEVFNSAKRSQRIRTEKRLILFKSLVKCKGVVSGIVF